MSEFSIILLGCLLGQILYLLLSQITDIIQKFYNHKATKKVSKLFQEEFMMEVSNE